MKHLLIRNKNAMLELLEGDINFEKIRLVRNLKADDQTTKILGLAHQKKVKIEEVPIHQMPTQRSGKNKEVLAAYIQATNVTTLDNLIEDLQTKGEDPFFLLANRVDYQNNIGAIVRTAYAAGVNGLIFQGDENQFLNEDTLHYSLGTIARIPLVKLSLFASVQKLQKHDILTYALDMSGESLYETDLSGPAAIILGEERKGLSQNVLEKCDKKISIPMQPGIDSLNVSVSAGIIVYEKVRQMGMK